MKIALLCPFVFSLLACVPATAQLKAYGGKKTDNNCKVIYLVNPTDTIYYIAGLDQNSLSDCRTFASAQAGVGAVQLINVSTHENDYLLLLPRDTIVYNVLISQPNEQRDKELSVMARSSAAVIATNKDKKRNRQIKRLPGMRINIPIIER